MALPMLSKFLTPLKNGVKSKGRGGVTWLCGYLIDKTTCLMKKLKYILVLILPLLLSGCVAEWRLGNKEDRIIGVWEIERAFYREYGDLFRENIIEFYNGDRIEFLLDYTAIYEDYPSGFLSFGDWELFLTSDRYSDDEDIDFFLDCYFYDNRGRFAFDLNGEATRLTWNRFNLRIPDRGGITILKMRKVN